MIQIDILKKFRYTKSGGMPNEKKKVYFDKTYLSLIDFKIAIPLKNNLTKVKV
jgi:hypothetical protein